MVKYSKIRHPKEARHSHNRIFVAIYFQGSATYSVKIAESSFSQLIPNFTTKAAPLTADKTLKATNPAYFRRIMPLSDSRQHKVPDIPERAKASSQRLLSCGHRPPAKLRDQISRLYMTYASTIPSVGWSKASGIVPIMAKPNLRHSRSAPALLASTKLNCMAI